MKLKEYFPKTDWQGEQSFPFLCCHLPLIIHPLSLSLPRSLCLRSVPCYDIAGGSVQTFRSMWEWWALQSGRAPPLPTGDFIIWQPCVDVPQHSTGNKKKHHKISHDWMSPHLSTWRSEQWEGGDASAASGGREEWKSEWIMTAASGLWEVVKQRVDNPIRMCHLWPHQSSLSRDQRADRWNCSAGDITRLHSHMKTFMFRGSNLLLEETVTNLYH